MFVSGSWSQLYHWDGKDTIPGGGRKDSDPPPGRTLLLGTIPTPAGVKAEGLAVRAEDASHYEILVAYDGAVNGAMRFFRAPRPAP